MAPLSDDDDNNNNYYGLNNRLQSLNSEQLAELSEYFALQANEDPTSENVDRNSDERSMTKRDALWTTTEVLDCIRRVKLYKNSSKLDLVTEMLNCYRRLKHADTEILVGIQQKSSTIIDWLPILSIILAVIICLIAFIVLCKQQIDHRHYIYSQIRQRRRSDNRNKNNNQMSLDEIDVAECIDSDMEFLPGLNILLAKGNIILDDNDAEMLNSMSTFDRLQYFQTLLNHVK
ncbi:unnamed protein product [Adineta steineri]|uniref:Uncharacterized protein n=3 Tax=Adineta steineri TaxID=433720 RepID=A0A814US51_9BILA|nr:unnamed protein product [Adineta steineri]